MTTTNDRRRAATRASVNRETVGEWMNLARRYARLGKHADAAECASKAIAIADEWADVFDEMSPGVRTKAAAYIANA